MGLLAHGAGDRPLVPVATVPDLFASSSREDARHRRPARRFGLAVVIGAALLAAGCSDSSTASDEGSAAVDADPAIESGVDDDLTAGTGGSVDDDAATAGDDESLAADDGEPEPGPDPLVELDVDDPEVVIAEIADQLEQTSATGTDLLALVDPVDGRELDLIDDTSDDSGATGTTGRRYNEAGELIQLDQSAQLACGQVEIAIGLIERGQLVEADDRLGTAAEQADQSSVEAIRSWADPLSGVAADGATAELVPLIGFLSVCAEGGYEL